MSITSDSIEVRKLHTNKIVEAIRNTMNLSIPYSETTAENFHTAIRVKNSNWSLDIWIRLYDIENFIVEFSTVQIPEEFRRKGIFTKVFEAIKNVDIVKEIRVTSVLTDEMRSWCTKNGLTSSIDPNIDDIEVMYSCIVNINELDYTCKVNQ